MKKFISLLLAVLFIAGTFAACGGKTENDFEGGTESALSQRQLKLFASFGITLDKDRIVAYKDLPDHIEYIVAIYEGDKKISEKSYFIYFNEQYYETKKDEYENAAGVEYKDDMATVVYNSSKANTGSYASDLALIKNDYTLRTN